MTARRIDLNCDLGESFGAYALGADAEIIPLVTSVNIACGFHAGDPAVMRRTARAAIEKGVAIGAHPGLPDLQGFGRRAMDVTSQEVSDMVLYQIGALFAIVRAEGGALSHVKPHGALYNMAATDTRLADAVADAVRRFDPGLVLFGLAGSESLRAAERAGLRVAAEAFADRTYQPNGTLTPRHHPKALLIDPSLSAAQAARIVIEGKVGTVEGKDISIQADTICIHGDGAHALAFAQAIRRRLDAESVTVIPCTTSGSRKEC
jgi:UPF0271 protein